MAIKIPRGEIPMPSVARNTNMMDLATVGSRATTSSLSELASTLFEIDKVSVFVIVGTTDKTSKSSILK